jgi:hypothetical protein
MLEIILEIIKYTIPGIVVCVVVYIILNNYVKKEEKLKMLELKMATGKDVIPIKLQAYERISLLLHRISADNLIPRVPGTGLTVKVYRSKLINNIKSEFEHNITQQVYVSSTVWNALLAYKNDLINVVNIQAAKLDDNENGFELSKAVLEYYINNPEAINAQKVLDVVKQEVKTLFI